MQAWAWRTYGAFGDVDIDNKLLHINKTKKKKGMQQANFNYYAKDLKTSNRSCNASGLSNRRNKRIQRALPWYRCHDSLLNIKQLSIENKKDKYLKLAGLPHMRAHDFRHSHVTNTVELGENPLLMANRLGHSDSKMTPYYMRTFTRTNK